MVYLLLRLFFLRRQLVSRVDDHAHLSRCSLVCLILLRNGVDIEMQTEKFGEGLLTEHSLRLQIALLRVLGWQAVGSTGGTFESATVSEIVDNTYLSSFVQRPRPNFMRQIFRISASSLVQPEFTDTLASEPLDFICMFLFFIIAHQFLKSI